MTSLFPPTLIAALALTSTALAQLPTEIHYQGRLADSGVPVTGLADITVRLYDRFSGGSALASETHVGVPVTDGQFSLSLSFGDAPWNASFSDGRYIEAVVTYPQFTGPTVTLAPRHKILAAPRAMTTRGLEVRGDATAGYKVGINSDAPRAALDVNGPGEAGAYGHVAIFENDLSNASQTNGVAIKINTTDTHGGNNFVTFYDDAANTIGRIEGFSLAHFDWAPPPVSYLDLINAFPPTLHLEFDPGQVPTPTLNGGRPPSLSFTGGSLPSASFHGGSLPSASFSGGSLPSLSMTTTRILGVDVFTGFSFSPGSLPSLNFSPGSLPTLAFDPGSFPTPIFDPGALPILTFSGPLIPPSASLTTNLPIQQVVTDTVEWALINDLDTMATLDPVNLAMASSKITALQLIKNGGTTYGSKGADYAEWLPKMNPDDKFHMGQIVGVFGGKISLKTEGADQVMAISCMPIVLGNLPNDGNTDGYDKAAFVGQVPVFVRGHVDSGDYIVPSGREDGTAVAVAPDDLTIEHLEHLVGRAWASSDNGLFSLINVVVGQRGGEVATVFRNQQRKIDAVAKANRGLEQQLADSREQHADLESRLTALEAALAAVTVEGPR